MTHKQKITALAEHIANDPTLRESIVNREQKITALAEHIANEAGIGSRVVVLLLERAAREGFDLAIEEVSEG